MIFSFIIAGILYGMWPPLMKKSGLEAPAQSLLYAVGAMLVLVPWFAMQKGGKHFTIVSLGFGVALLAALINGVGTIFSTRGLRAIPDQQAGAGVLLMLVVIVLVNEVMGMLLFGSPMTVKKALGVASAIITFILLAR